LLRLEELAALKQLAANANARLYLSMPHDAVKRASESD
jgi:hypothetical protein